MSEDLNPKQKAFQKRYTNKLNDLISYKDVQNIKNYFKRNFKEEQRPKNLREELKTKTPEEIKQLSKFGQELYTEPLNEMFLVDTAMDSNETTTDMRLSQAEAENTKLFYKNKEVTKKELQRILQDYSDEIKADAIENGLNWYKTYALLLVDYETNTIMFDEDVEFDPIADAPKNMNLRKEQIKWLENYKQSLAN
jgi:hypothetical protein